MYKVLFWFNVLVHHFVIFSVTLSAFMAGSYFSFPFNIFVWVIIFRIVTDRRGCAWTRWENNIRKELGMPQISSFMGHYYAKPFYKFVEAHKKLKMSRPILTMTITRLLYDNGYITTRELAHEVRYTYQPSKLLPMIYFWTYRVLVAVPVVLLIRLVPVALPIVSYIARKVWIDYAIGKGKELLKAEKKHVKKGKR